MYLIHQLAKHTHISTDSIRFYEKKHLIKPALKAANGYRYYDEKNLQTLIFIKNCRSLGIAIEAIKQLLDLFQQQQESCQQVDSLIDHHLHTIERKIQQLQLFQQQLLALRNRCDSKHTIQHCQILKGLQIDADIS